MSGVAPNPIGLHKSRPYSSFLSHQSPSPRLIKPSIGSHNQYRTSRTLRCQTNPNDSSSTEKPGETNVDTAQAADFSVGSGIPEYPSKTVNKQIALVSTLAAVGLFLSARLDLSISLKDLSAMALPYEEALSPMGSPLLWSFMHIGVKYVES